MRKKFMTLCFCIISSVLNAYAINYPTITPSSPQAQDLMKYVDYPVDYTSGLPEVNIPLYTINSSRISVPISLSYHASGFKPNEVNSIVGQGWTLNAGNRISRAIKNVPDEICLTNLMKDVALDFPDYITSMDTVSDPGVVYLMEQAGEYSGLQRSDSEYDIFYYDHLGGNGKFIFERNTEGLFKPVTLPYSPIVINTTGSMHATYVRQQIDRFQIIDENGTLYNYGKSISSTADAYEEIEVYDNYSSIDKGTGKTSWLLTEIISADKSDTIYYEYTNAVWKTEHNIPYNKSWSSTFPGDEGSLNADATWMYQARIHKYTQRLLDKIKFKGGEVSFTYTTSSSGTSRLSKIKVYDKVNNTTQQTIKLDLVAYGTGGHWHKLNKIEFQNSQFVTEQKYSFTYYEPTLSPSYPTMSKPSTSGTTYATCSIDHWGFYNGAQNSSLLGPAHSGDIYATHPNLRVLYGDADRNPNTAYAKVGVLKEITYPTGGTTTFEYEGNESGYGIAVGGLRVNKISKNSGNDNHFRTYQYGEGVSVSGEPSMYLYGVNGFKNSRYFSNRTDYTATYTLSSSPHIDFNMNSQPITYTRVTEYMGDVNNNTGNIMHLFDNTALMKVSDISLDYYPTPALQSGTSWFAIYRIFPTEWVPNRYYQKAYRFGKTYEKETVISDSENKARKKIVRNYSTTVKNTYKGLLAKRLLARESGVIRNFDFWKRNYTIEQLLQNLTSETVYEYPTDGGATIITIKSYEYNNHNQLVRESVQQSDNSIWRTEYKYPVDFTSAAYPAVYREMVDKNILTPVIQKSTYRNNALIDREETDYAKWHSSFFAPSTIKAWKKGVVLSGNPVMEARLRFTHYDYLGNPLSIVKNDTETTTYLWGYKGKHLIAEFKNATYNDVKAAAYGTLPETLSIPETPSLISINSLRLLLPNASVTTFAYKPLCGIETIIAPNEEKITFTYDSFGWLLNVKDHNNKEVEEYSYNLAHAQVNTQNYVRTRTMLNDTGTDYLEQIQYYDGLGRPFQTVRKKAAPNVSGNLNLITLQEYDNMGRESNSWLPIASSSQYLDPALFKTAAVGSLNYTNETYPYTRNIYENSPVGQLVKQYGPGDDWANAPIQNMHTSNTTSGDTSCGYYYVNSSGQLVRSGVYSSARLFVTKHTDELDSLSYTFTNIAGQVLLTRQISNAQKFDTHYVYDDYGLLRYVLPPLASDALSASGTYTSSDTSLKNYAYIYQYDGRGRCVSKKLPGCDAITYVYDNADRLIFSQNGEQAAKTIPEWTFYLYDSFGRMIVKGICTNTNTSNVNHVVVTTTFTPSNTGLGNSGYTSSFALVSPVIHLVNYYDNYNFRSLTGFNNTNFPAATINAKGRLTGNVTAILESTDKLFSATYYDIKGNPLKTISSNHLGGYDVVTTIYNFSGSLSNMIHTHTSSGTEGYRETYDYTYDNSWNRLKKTTHRHDVMSNGGATTYGTPTVIAENTYDLWGRLGNVERKGLMSLKDTYTYNIRSWIKSITGYHFTEELTYTLNGNVETMQFGFSNNRRSYNYTYDALSRLTAAAYTPPTNNPSENYQTSYRYDKNGNIDRIQRYGKKTASGYALVDDFTNMTYTGNQLTDITEEVANFTLAASNDLPKKTSTNSAYAYNKNGAMTKDLNKKISNISYNSLDLPKELTFVSQPQSLVTTIGGVEFTLTSGGKALTSGGSTRTHTYTYAADGRKLRVVQGDTSRDYVGNIIYENGSLKRILVDGGYIEGGMYYFNFNDHLGNIRAVATQTGTTYQKNDYYPFGLPMAETSDTDQNKQPYKYNGKEFERKDGLNWMDYGARHYDAAIGRFTTMDPMAEKYYSVSPYAYCTNNPVRFVDLDGCSTWVMQNEDGTYRIVGGDLNDDDLNIYVWNIQDGQLVKGESIGESELISSFYFSESNNWAIGSIIDPNDSSGMEFLESFMNEMPTITNYMDKAAGWGKYDFKRNGAIKGDEKTDSPIYFYRGMPTRTRNGKTIYSSARDIGNYAAGYIAGSHQIKWEWARKQFDKLESIQNNSPTIEGYSTQNAQYHGWSQGWADSFNQPWRTIKWTTRSIPGGIKWLLKR